MRNARALANAKLALAEILEAGSCFSEALAVAFEANRIVCELGLEDALRVRCLTTLGSMRILAGNPVKAALPDLSVAYSLARANGLAYDAMALANNFSELHVSAKSYKRALSFGIQAMRAAELIGADERSRALIRCTVARVYLANSDPKAARNVLEPPIDSTAEARSYVSQIPYIVRAELLLAEHRYESAFKESVKAVQAMESIGSKRGLGSALRVKAQAQAALGRRKDALGSIHDAIELLSKLAPPTALARAYLCAARLTGDRRQKRKANDLMNLSQL
jgi:tetratricopeptide (TPR) repeat protein